LGGWLKEGESFPQIKSLLQNKAFRERKEKIIFPGKTQSSLNNPPIENLGTPKKGRKINIQNKELGIKPKVKKTPGRNLRNPFLNQVSPNPLKT